MAECKPLDFTVTGTIGNSILSYGKGLRLRVELRLNYRTHARFPETWKMGHRVRLYPHKEFERKLEELRACIDV